MNPDSPTPVPAPNTPSALPEEAIWDALRHVLDPEIGLNIVDLGLVYSIHLEGPRIGVVMTVTTPGCPMVHSLTFGVETALLALPGVEHVEVEIVHDPPWTPEMMTPEGRQAAGIR